MGKFLQALCEQLIDYVRQCAWLNTVPHPAEGEKLDPTKPRLSRREEFDRDGFEYLYPECDASYLAVYLFEIGPLSALGTSETAISHLEIRSWQDNTGIDLAPWECRALRTASQAYAHQVSKSRDPRCPTPLDDPEAVEASIEANREAVERQVRAFLSGQSTT